MYCLETLDDHFLPLRPRGSSLHGVSSELLHPYGYAHGEFRRIAYPPCGRRRASENPVEDAGGFRRICGAGLKEFYARFVDRSSRGPDLLIRDRRSASIMFDSSPPISFDGIS